MQDQSPAIRDAAAMYINRVSKLFQEQFEPQLEENRLVLDFTAGESAQMSNVATVGVLVGMLLPAVQAVREAARRTAASNNIRQCCLAALNYESSYQELPADIYDDDGTPLLSWRVRILPFLDQNELYQQFKLDEPWDSPHNIKLLSKMPATFAGPNSLHDNKTVFLGVSGPGTMFEAGKKINLGQITDGTSNTIFFVETNDSAAVEWTKPEDYRLDKDNPTWGLWGNRPGGFNAGFVDGSVQFISLDTEDEMIIRMMLKADGNPVQR